MEKFEAIKVEEKLIELKSIEDVEKIYKLLEDNEDFILKYSNNGYTHSELIIANNVFAKVKNGEIKLLSSEGGDDIE